MKMKVLFSGILILSFSAALFAQEISRDEFRDAEWKMKSIYFQKLMELQEQGLLLDQSDYDVKYWELDIDVTDIAGETINFVAEYDSTTSKTIDVVVENNVAGY